MIKTRGDANRVMQADAVLEQHKDHWLVRETIGALRRTLARLDVTSRSLIALVDEGSCFAGTFYELALACDRIYMLDLPDAPDAAPALQLNAANFGRYPGGQRPDAPADALQRRRDDHRAAARRCRTARCAPTRRWASAW